jgi:hypothetical protein
MRDRYDFNCYDIHRHDPDKYLPGWNARPDWSYIPVNPVDPKRDQHDCHWQEDGTLVTRLEYCNPTPIDRFRHHRHCPHRDRLELNKTIIDEEAVLSPVQLLCLFGGGDFKIIIESVDG